MIDKKLTVFAIVAHPDDIEFMMAGTLFLLKDAGADIHLWNLCNGGCGSMVYSYEETVRIRWEEGQAAAREIGAQIYPSIADDMELFYDAPTVAKVGAVIRRVKPDIVLTQPPQDYMEDHTNACRLAVGGTFTREIPNYATHPPVPPMSGPTVVYHALPHGLTDTLRVPVEPESFVDIGAALERKRSMLAKHASQKDWLDATQGMGSYLNNMVETSRQVGQMSGRFEFAEGWRRHLHYGFASAEADPIRDLLGELVMKNPRYPSRS